MDFGATDALWLHPSKETRKKDQGQNSRETHCPSFNLNVGLIRASDVEVRLHKTNGPPEHPSVLFITQSAYVTISDT